MLAFLKRAIIRAEKGNNFEKDFFLFPEALMIRRVVGEISLHTFHMLFSATVNKLSIWSQSDSELGRVFCNLEK